MKIMSEFNDVVTISVLIKELEKIMKLKGDIPVTMFEVGDENDEPQLEWHANISSIEVAVTKHGVEVVALL